MTQDSNEISVLAAWFFVNVPEELNAYIIRLANEWLQLCNPKAVDVIKVVRDFANSLEDDE